MTPEQYIAAIECDECEGTGEVTDMNASFSVDQMNFIADPIVVTCEACDGTGEKPCAK